MAENWCAAFFQPAQGEFEYLKTSDNYGCNFSRVLRWISTLPDIQSASPNSHQCGHSSLGKGNIILLQESVHVAYSSASKLFHPRSPLDMLEPTLEPPMANRLMRIWLRGILEGQPANLDNILRQFAHIRIYIQDSLRTYQTRYKNHLMIQQG